MKNYKKVILTLLVAILGMGAANAQLRFGLKAGVNLNDLSVTRLPNLDDLNENNRCGYTLGAMTEFQIPVIGLCFDLSLMYTYMNSDVKFKDVNDIKNFDISKSFIEVPINVKYKIGLPVVSKFLTPYVFTGPAFAFRLGSLNKNYKDLVDLKTTQTSWNVGLGVELIKHIQISGSYGFGLNDPFKFTDKFLQNAGISNDKHIKSKSNYWTITAAWLF